MGVLEIAMGFISQLLDWRHEKTAFNAVEADNAAALAQLSISPNHKRAVKMSQKTHDQLKFQYRLEKRYNSLLKNTPEPQGFDFKESLLDVALTKNSLNCVKWLLDNGASPYPQTQSAIMAQSRLFLTFVPEALKNNTLPASYLDHPLGEMVMAFYRAERNQPTSLNSDNTSPNRTSHLTQSPLLEQWLAQQLPAYENKLRGSQGAPQAASLKV